MTDPETHAFVLLIFPFLWCVGGSHCPIYLSLQSGDKIRHLNCERPLKKKYHESIICRAREEESSQSHLGFLSSALFRMCATWLQVKSRVLRVVYFCATLKLGTKAQK